MSYNYFIDQPIIIADQRFKEFCWAHDIKITLHHVMKTLLDEYKVHSEPIAHGVEVLGGPIVSERHGVKGIEDALTPVLKYARPGDYTIEDEHGETVTITVE